MSENSSAVEADYYVAANGDDAWSGALPEPNASGTDGPLATLPRARDAVRQSSAKDAAPRAYTVLIRGGVYPLEEPIVFSPEDSGAENAPITYAAYPGETPVFSGGRAIAGWRKGQDDLWEAQIPAAKAGQWDFHQLFVNGRRRQPARIPNEGYLRTNGPLVEYARDRTKPFVPESRMGFRHKDADLKPWGNLEDVHIFVYHSWTASLHWIDKLDEQKGEVRFANPCQWPIGWWERQQRYVVENVREGLDAPGEWHLDRASGRLEYWPMSGEDMTKAEVVAPRLIELVRFEGDWQAGRLVHDIVLRGLSFQHADWAADKTRPVDGQAATFLTGAVFARGAERLSIERCEIAHVGGYALWLESGCKHNRVFHCEIHDLGGGGVRIGENQRQKTRSKDETEDRAATPELTLDGAGSRDTGHNVVDNNFIHDGGRVFVAGMGVLIGHSAYNRVTHNEICDFFQSGVSVGWVWGFGKSAAHHNEIADNHIHHYGQGVSSDMGGVYTLGPSPGTRVAHNLIHHAYSYSYGGWGLYTDEGSSGIVLENNIVYDTKSGGFHQHYGADNIVQNNIFAFSREAQIIRAREDRKCSFTFERNIVLCDNDGVLGKVWNNGDYNVDYNVYWVSTGEDGDFGGRTFAEWQATGQDPHSLIADPMFVNPAARDFRLQPGSPAEKVGFQPLDLSNIGLYGEPEWVAAPTKVVRREIEIPRPATSQPIDDGFEKTDVGAGPERATFMGESGEAAIRVTDEAAASGAHSLKFSDAPGLAQAYQPHMFYKVDFKKGVARASFDVRLEPDAILMHEWRDAARPYRVGPSIRIEANGDFLASKRKLTTVPRSQWIRVEIACGLGRESTGAYDLTVTAAGSEPRRFEGLPCGAPEFKRLQWFGFMSLATQKTVFCLDNIFLRTSD